MGTETIGRGRALVLLTAAAGHLGLVIIVGALQVDLRGRGPLADAVAAYGTLSGADSGYAFFAPGVGSPPTATFEIMDATGAVTTDRLMSGANAEARLRAGNIVDRFWEEEDQALKRTIAASWAGKMFARHPAAAGVVVRVEECEVAPMQEYRHQDELTCDLHYRAKLVPHEKPRTAHAADREAP
ncbi:MULTISPECIES: hypothetical protein [Sorangium]|uniref:Uncharacterized protein n=1 Tax=Sorangium cellulosum TaxID=56 RepID=A0A4P2QUT6_SORCE|nr:MULTISPECIES: hypothetical protein [Sorangium]AUX34167.1 hypothetical protein SOCE836_063360 [Sorangium cellulosum]WCQ93480.1 hypothetical protein NQZ70_06229 [Sorangium sp. Soce836]